LSNSGQGQSQPQSQGQAETSVSKDEEEDELEYHVSSVKERKSWMERFEELKAFKEKHGHCNVPWKWKENLPLFYWVRRMKDKKRAGALSEERVAMMEDIGFEWVKGQNKERERKKQHAALLEQKRKQLKHEREQQLQQQVGGLTIPTLVPSDALAQHLHQQSLQNQIPFDLQGTSLSDQLQGVGHVGVGVGVGVGGLAYPTSYTITTGAVDASGSPTSAMISPYGFAKLYAQGLVGLPTSLPGGDLGVGVVQYITPLPQQVMAEVVEAAEQTVPEKEGKLDEEEEKGVEDMEHKGEKDESEAVVDMVEAPNHMPV
jgi:hypothetical protein